MLCHTHNENCPRYHGVWLATEVGVGSSPFPVFFFRIKMLHNIETLQFICDEVGMYVLFIY